MSETTYKTVTVWDSDPSGEAGLAINNNFKTLADATDFALFTIDNATIANDTWTALDITNTVNSNYWNSEDGYIEIPADGTYEIAYSVPSLPAANCHLSLMKWNGPQPSGSFSFGFETNSLGEFYNASHSNYSTWAVSTTNPHSGTYCARSNAYQGSKPLTLVKTIATGSGNVSFYVHVPGIYYGFFRFSITNGTTTNYDYASGSHSTWTQKSYALAAGMNTLTWTIYSDYDGENNCGVDDVIVSGVSGGSAYSFPTQSWLYTENNNTVVHVASLSAGDTLNPFLYQDTGSSRALVPNDYPTTSSGLISIRRLA